MRSFTVAHSAVFATAVAAISVTRPGAQPSMPTGDEVEYFLEHHSITTAQAPSYTKHVMTQQLTQVSSVAEDWIFASPVKIGRLPYSCTGVW